MPLPPLTPTYTPLVLSALLPGNVSVLYSQTHPLCRLRLGGWGWGRMPAPSLGEREFLEVVLSLNGVFGRPTGFESMIESGRAKFA